MADDDRDTEFFIEHFGENPALQDISTKQHHNAVFVDYTSTSIAEENGHTCTGKSKY